MVELGTRCTTKRVHDGNSPPKAARAPVLSRPPSHRPVWCKRGLGNKRVALSPEGYFESHILKNIAHEFFRSLQELAHHLGSVLQNLLVTLCQTIVAFSRRWLEEVIYHRLISEYEYHFTCRLADSRCELVFGKVKIG